MLLAASRSASSMASAPSRKPSSSAIRLLRAVRVADDETGELESATILGRFGEVPEDFAETLQAA